LIFHIFLSRIESNEKLIFIGVLILNSAFAGAGFMDIGYVNVSSDAAETQNGVNLNFGAKFGESFKNRIGVEYVYVKNDNDSISGMGDIYYTLGYEILKDFSIGANVGFGYEDVGTIRSGSSSTDIIATGLTYGATAVYELNKNLELVAEYKKYDLSAEVFSQTIDYNRDVITVSIGFCFSKDKR
jgi:hypothetical protein